LGVVTGLSGGEAGWQQCLPATWQSANAADDGGSSPIADKLNSLSGPLGVVKDIVGFGVKIACKFKNKLQDWLLEKLKRKFYRRRYFRFIQKRTRSSRKHKKIDLNPITALGNKIWDKIKGMISSIAQKVHDFFQSDWMTKLMNFFNCVKSAVQAAKNMVSMVTGFISKVRDITTAASAGGFPVIAAVLKILIDCICNYEQFFKALDFLIKGIKASGTSRFNYLGQFVGGLIYAVGTA